MAEKGLRGGKRANTKITSENQKTRGREPGKGAYQSRTYTFYDAKLGMRQITARSKKQAIQKARTMGYTEFDLRQ